MISDEQRKRIEELYSDPKLREEFKRGCDEFDRLIYEVWYKPVIEAFYRQSEETEKEGQK